MPKQEITWGDKARPLSFRDICRGQARLGKKQDVRGWMIEFFGENTRAEIAFSRHFAEKAQINANQIESWSDTSTIKQQVQFFNETLIDLKIIKPPKKKRAKS
jgi:hypothetical protein